MTGWDDPHNAELYDRFACDHGLYRETSRDLVELARLDDAALVVDLACGTGVTTQAILDRVQESANVVALDASEAMLAIDIITRSGLVLDEARTFEYDSPLEAQLAWLSVPVFAQNVLPGMPYDQQLGVLAKAYERFDKSSGAKGVWMAFVAHKP